MNNKEMSEHLIKAHQENLSKFSYFIFGVSTASIGYAINSTNDEVFSCSLVLWFLSIVLMFLSTVFGVLYIKTTNMAILDAAMTSVLIDKYKEANGENSVLPESYFENGRILDTKTGCYMNYQLYSLGFGFFMYFIWHVSKFFS